MGKVANRLSNLYFDSAYLGGGNKLRAYLFLIYVLGRVCPHLGAQFNQDAKREGERERERGREKRRRKRERDR